MTFKAKLGIICGLLCGPLAFAQTPLEEPPDLGLIDGYVVRVASGEPLKSAQVVLRPERGRSPTFRAVTDASGHFTLESIQPGNYRLHVERDGYVDHQYGQISPSRPGTVLVLAPGLTNGASRRARYEERDPRRSLGPRDDVKRILAN